MSYEMLEVYRKHHQKTKVIAKRKEMQQVTAFLMVQ